MSSYTNWLNANEARAYPLHDDTTRIDDAGQRLPDTLIADIGIVVPTGAGELYISSAYVSPTIISVAVSAAGGIVLTGSYSAQMSQRYRTLPLTPTTDDVSGWVSFGGHKAGTPTRYNFSTPAQSGLLPGVVTIIEPPAVASLYGKDDVHATGLVRITGDSNFTIQQDPHDPQTVRIGLTANARTAFTEPCSLPASEDNCGSPPLRSIAGVPADKDGNLYIVFE